MVTFILIILAFSLVFALLFLPADEKYTCYDCGGTIEEVKSRRTKSEKLYRCNNCGKEFWIDRGEK